MLHLNPSIIFTSKHQPSGWCTRRQPTRLSLWRASRWQKQMSAKHHQTPDTGWGKGSPPRNQPCLPGHMPAAMHSSLSSQPWLSFRGLGAPPTSHHANREETPPWNLPGSKVPSFIRCPHPCFPPQIPCHRGGTQQSLECSHVIMTKNSKRIPSLHRGHRNGHNFIWVQTKEDVHRSSETITD